MRGGGVHGMGHAWACVAGGTCMVGACVVGDVWQGACMAGEMPPDTMRYGRSMRGRYASYWNAFFFLFVCMFCYYSWELNIN